jgi:hypothetical protein
MSIIRSPQPRDGAGDIWTQDAATNKRGGYVASERCEQDLTTKPGRPVRAALPDRWPER